MANWEHKKMTNDELKTLVREVYDNKVFTSFQCGNNAMMVFMPMMFFGSAPSTPTIVDNNQINRKNKLKYIDDKLQYEEETPQRKEFIKNIGMLYENYSEAAPRGVNGMPMFYSCKIVSIEDAQKFVEMYNKYLKIREDFEKEWGVEEAT